MRAQFPCRASIWLVKVAAAVAVAVLSPVAAHGEPVAPRSRNGTAAEIARLDSELKQQRQIIMQLMQIEQQHYDLLLKLIQSGGASGGNANPAGSPSAVGAGARGTLVFPGAEGQRAADGVPVSGGAGASMATAPARRAPPERTATVTGKVELPKGANAEVYVFAQNVHGTPVRGRTIEIGQRDKQFVPTVAVVQRGTRVAFPNYDAVFHNVFSLAPPHAFDLGSYRAGDSPRAVEMTSTGVVDVFCNMHAKMHASILVVPSAVWTRVAPDGSFRLDNVPLGSRKLVAWSPRTRPTEQTIDVGPTGGVASFTLSLEPQRAHNNKYGLPYGSYKD